jgi:hypothetical protein
MMCLHWLLFFFGSGWQVKHVTISLFKPTTTIEQALIQNLTKLLDKYALKRKIIAYVKDEGSNLNAMTNALKYVISCDCLGFEESFQGSFFGHARHANMVQQMKKDAKISNMSILSLHKQIYKSALPGQIFLGRVGKSVRKLVFKTKYINKNKVLFIAYTK